jgi:hypothetical protein
MRQKLPKLRQTEQDLSRLKNARDQTGFERL